MADYERIDCECGHVYATKQAISNCPACGKRNTSSSGGLTIIAIIVGLVLFVGLMLGPLAYAWYAKELKRWHALVAAGLGVAAVWFWSDSTEDWLLYSGVGLNGLAVLLGGYRFIQGGKG